MRVDLFIILFYIASVSGDLDLASNVRNFSVELLYHAQKDTNANVVLSPYMIWSSLVSLTYQLLGDTREFPNQMPLTKQNRNEFVEQFKNLRTSFLATEGVNITLQNYLFYNEDLHIYPENIRRLQTDFGFVVNHHKFETYDLVIFPELSLLISQCGLPPKWILPSIKGETTMIMCNCLTFKANWLEPFSGREYSSTMHVKAHLRSSYFESLQATVTELPFEGGRHCMLVIRPHDWYYVKHVYINLRNVSLKDILGKLQSDAVEFGLTEVEEELPKGEFSSEVILNEAFFDMGLSDVFNKNASSFDNFAEDKIYIYEINQRVSVRFDYLEMTVHAVTPSYNLGSQIVSRNEIYLKPFIFFIMDKTKSTVLIGGTYTNRFPYTNRLIFERQTALSRPW